MYERVTSRLRSMTLLSLPDGHIPTCLAEPSQKKIPGHRAESIYRGFTKMYVISYGLLITEPEGFATGVDFGALGAGVETGLGDGVETLGDGEGVDTGRGELVEGVLVLPELPELELPELELPEPLVLGVDVLGSFVVVVGTLQRGFSGSTGGSYGFGCFVVVVVVPCVVPEPPTVSLPTVPDPDCVIG